MKEISRKVTVDEISEIPARGPWQTKSGGDLMVTMAMDYEVLQSTYLHYDESETGSIIGKFDIRGLRIYTVRGLREGQIGGTEWHRIREEMVFSLEGSVRWVCEDLYGGTREFLLNGNEGLWMPPFILHTYHVLEGGSGLLVVANTLFDPHNVSTHDTYSTEAFRELAGRAQNVRS